MLPHTLFSSGCRFIHINLRPGLPWTFPLPRPGPIQMTMEQGASQDLLAQPPWYSRLCIFCRDKYFSRFLLSFISFPYLPTVPSSDRMKWECMLLSVVSLLRGFPRVWYRHTTCKTARKGEDQILMSSPWLKSSKCSKCLFLCTAENVFLYRVF